MSPGDARREVYAALTEIAPDCDPTTVDPRRPIREQIELDSMDQLNVMIALGEATGVEIPERDYSHVNSIDGLVTYLVAHSPA